MGLKLVFCLGRRFMFFLTIVMLSCLQYGKNNLITLEKEVMVV
ncbi:hypothetical protein KR49_13070 [Synechococcus sp. KORDI-49]|nr:hypothetical protein KR49_13070 [Synechococcus sp. KORDI-49]